MTSLGAATARWAYVVDNVNEAILIAGQKDVCMCAADHERSQRRSAAVAGMLRRGSVCVRERCRNEPVQQHGLQTNNVLPWDPPCGCAGHQITTRWFGVGFEMPPPCVRR